MILPVFILRRVNMEKMINTDTPISKEIMVELKLLAVLGTISMLYVIYVNMRWFYV